MVFGIPTQGWNVLCVVFVFLVGVGLHIFGYDLGKDIVIGALGALWTLIKVANNNTSNVNVEQANMRTLVADQTTSEPQK